MKTKNLLLTQVALALVICASSYGQESVREQSDSDQMTHELEFIARNRALLRAAARESTAQTGSPRPQPWSTLIVAGRNFRRKGSDPLLPEGTLKNEQQQGNPWVELEKKVSSSNPLRGSIPHEICSQDRTRTANGVAAIWIEQRFQGTALALQVP